MLVRRAHRIAMLAEHLGTGIAETENGLVNVPHGIKITASSEQVKEARLLAIGVLVLVHQDLEKLSLHPVANRRVLFKEPDGEVFEIGEVEGSEFLLLLRIEGVEALQNLDQ